MCIRVKLARPLIQTAWFEVTADSEQEAVAKVVEQAGQLPASDWQGEFDE